MFSDYKIDNYIMHNNHVILGTQAVGVLAARSILSHPPVLGCRIIQSELFGSSENSNSEVLLFKSVTKLLLFVKTCRKFQSKVVTKVSMGGSKLLGCWWAQSLMGAGSSVMVVDCYTHCV